MCYVYFVKQLFLSTIVLPRINFTLQSISINHRSRQYTVDSYHAFLEFQHVFNVTTKDISEI